MSRIPPRLEPIVAEARRVSLADPFLISGAIAYNVVFALVPLAFASVATVSMLSLNEDVIAWISGLVAEGVPGDVSGFLNSTIDEAEVFVGSMGTAVLVVSLLVALWSGSRAIYAIQKALRLIEGAEVRRAYWAARGLGILFTLGAGVALVFAYIMLLFGGWVMEVLERLGIPVGGVTTSVIVIAGWVIVVLFAIYRWGIAVPIRRPLVSAAVVAILLMLATWIGALLLPSFTGGTTAALGSMGVILVWSYAVGFIIITAPSAVSAIERVARGTES